MSKIFRRPMFSGGSTNMNGIMSGIEDTPRRKLAFSTDEEGLKSDVQKRLDLIESISGGKSPSEDPLTKFLLSYGPSLAKTQPIGSGLTGAITTGLAAADEPLKQTFADFARDRQTKQVLTADILDKVLEEDDPTKYQEAIDFLVEKTNASPEAAARIVKDKFFNRGKDEISDEELAKRYVEIGLFDNEQDALVTIAKSKLFVDPKDPETLAQESLKDRALAYQNATIDPLTGQSGLKPNTSIEFVEAYDGLKENDPDVYNSVDTDKFIITQPTTSVIENENGTLSLKDPDEREDYTDGLVYYNAQKRLFYRFEAGQFVPINQT